MTNAEAIEVLRANYPDACYEQLREAVDMAIEALKAQLFHEGTTSDLISRTETVERLRRVLDATVPITDYDSGYVDGVEFGVSTVSTMPTVQPQSTTGQLNDSAQSTDLIDRQAALNALMDAVKSVGVLDADDIKTVFDMLPSAQPEPHEGHWIEGEIYRDAIECNCSECGQLMTTAASVRMSFCPNCGARMTR